MTRHFIAMSGNYELFTGMDRYCMPPADTIPEKPRRGRRCRPGTKHPYDGDAERKIQRVCHA